MAGNSTFVKNHRADVSQIAVSTGRYAPSPVPVLASLVRRISRLVSSEPSGREPYLIGWPSAPTTYQTLLEPWPLVSPLAASPAKR